MSDFTVLQHLLSCSFAAKLLAVKSVITSKGSRTPGIDGVRWRTPRQRWLAAIVLNSHGYHAQPLLRVLNPKKNGKTRPLGIPTLHDRAMQALYALGIKPIAETVVPILCNMTLGGLQNKYHHRCQS